MASNVLIIYEGANTEKQLISGLFKFVGKEDTYSPFCYGCNIYALYDALVRNAPNSDFENLDIIAVLRELPSIPSKANPSVLDKPFTDIFLVFDLDFHDSRSDKRKISILRLMSEKFRDSTDGGKLLINSPMCESYRDFSNINDSLRLNEPIPLSDSRKYKEIVGKRGIQIRISKWPRKIWSSVIEAHYGSIASLLKELKNGSYPYFVRLYILDPVDVVSATLSHIASTNLIPVFNETLLIPFHIFGQRLSNYQN